MTTIHSEDVDHLLNLLEQPEEWEIEHPVKFRGATSDDSMSPRYIPPDGGEEYLSDYINSDGDQMLENGENHWDFRDRYMQKMLLHIG